jgi:glycosyltransferase involved in cell wall biosynthesis
MNIVILQTVWGTAKSGSSGGGTDHFAELSALWKRLGHDVTFVTNAYDQRATTYDANRVVILPSLGTIGSHYPLGTILEYVCNLPLQIGSLRKLDSAGEAGSTRILVISTSSFPSDVAAAACLTRQFGCEGAVYFHHLAPPPWWLASRRGSPVRTIGNWILQQIALATVKIFGLVPTLDQPTSARLSAWRIPGGFVADREFLEPSRFPMPVEKERDLDAVYIGGLVERKGALELVPLWSEIVRSLPNAKLAIAGRAERSEVVSKIMWQIEHFRLSKQVSMEGYVSHSRKVELLARAKLFLYPSYEEGWSRAVMEAAASGCVPITWDLPAYSYLGPLAPKAPVAKTSALVEQCVRMIQDESRRRESAFDMRQRILMILPEEVAHEQLDQILSHPYAHHVV